MSARALMWAVGALLYALFFYWYTNFDGPITPGEQAQLLAEMERRGRAPEELERMRHFMATDQGDQFIMVNAIDINESPPDLPVTGPDADGSALLAHYMEHMFPALFARACHPIFSGQAIADAMDLAGIEGAAHWEQAALMRYRSRRDMLEIAMDPAFQERHDYKIAGLTKTIAYPVAPGVYFSDLRLFLAMLLFVVLALIDMVVFRRKV